MGCEPPRAPRARARAMGWNRVPPVPRRHPRASGASRRPRRAPAPAAGPRDGDRRAAGPRAPRAGADLPRAARAHAGSALARWFDVHRAAYRRWYLQDGDAARPDLATCRRMLAAHMPELAPVYEHLVELAGADELDARLLSLYGPPPRSSRAARRRSGAGGGRCSCARTTIPASRLEGLLLLTEWGERRVIGMSDCVWGLLDGFNDRGLAVSLTFGGRRAAGRRLRDPAGPALPAGDLRHGGSGARGAPAGPRAHRPEPHGRGPLRRRT